MNRPAWKERYARWHASLTSNEPSRKLVNQIPALFAMGAWQLLEAYYGGSARALWEIAKLEAYLYLGSLHHRLLLRIVDLAGWTRLVEVPETPTHVAHWERHGWKCSAQSDCWDDTDSDCIDDSIPRWFKVVSRWPK